MGAPLHRLSGETGTGPVVIPGPGRPSRKVLRLLDELFFELRWCFLEGGVVFTVPSPSTPAPRNRLATFALVGRFLTDPITALFLPANCRICEQSIETLTRVPVCENCWQAVRAYEGVECFQCGMFLESAALLHETPNCGLCRREVFSFEQARSFGWYDGVLREIIQQFKYHGLRPLSNPLGVFLTKASERLGAASPDMVLPVPLHRNRERQRGFNQAALLAASVAKILGIREGGKDCVRVRDTPPQTGLRGAERRKNVKGAFAVPDPERIRGRRILLVDDVMTTGATADACVRALQDAGAGGVWVLTLARARAAARDGL